MVTHATKVDPLMKTPDTCASPADTCMNSAVEVEMTDVCLQFDANERPVLEHVDLKVSKKEFISIIGRSGSGKSTLLKLAAGLLKPTRGKVSIAGKCVDEPHEEMAYVFQKPVLLEWRTVLENVLLPIELQRPIVDEDRKQAVNYLDLVGLGADAHKFPHECSGGMMSRVALARALLVQPRILLMDEPFAALDTLTKEELQVELARLHQRFEPTIMFVTHDIQEAVYLSDRVFVLGGQPARIVQALTIPFEHPRSPDLKFSPRFAQLCREIHEKLPRFGSGDR